jgi:hypothetical protein
MFRVAECLAAELDQEFRRLTEDVTTDENTDLALMPQRMVTSSVPLSVLRITGAG